MIWLLRLGILQEGDVAELEDIVKEVTEEGAALNPRKLKTRGADRHPRAPLENGRLQYLYKMNKRAAAKRILTCESPACDIPTETVTEYFAKPANQRIDAPAPSVIPTRTFKRQERENTLSAAR